MTNLSNLFEQFLKEKQYIDGVTPKTLRTYRDSWSAFERYQGEVSPAWVKADEIGYWSEVKLDIIRKYAKTVRCYACRSGGFNLQTRFGGCGVARKGKPAGEGIPSRPSLAYNLSNSQWYIQWLRTLRNRGTERVPKRSRAGQRINADRLFLYGYRRRESF